IFGASGATLTTASSSAAVSGCSKLARSPRMSSLSEADRRAALQLARTAVVEAVSHRKLPDMFPIEGVFAERHGVFVTLHVAKRLQGCIGVIEANEPLAEAIVPFAHPPPTPQPDRK